MNDLENIATLYFYDTVTIGDDLLDIIVMKQYNGTLEFDPQAIEEKILYEYVEDFPEQLNIIKPNTSYKI